MGDAPAPSASVLDEELMGAREVAKTSVCFFDNVAPLARRLGIDAFPAFDTFLSRFSETEDINTDRLRADGRILQKVHTTAAAQVAYQHDQNAPLVDCWPDGSGTAAHQRLLLHLSRADADLTSLGELATGLLVAADCIDISRVAKFTAIGTIDANILLGMPISAWTAIVESLATAPREELRAAITAAVNLFTSSVNTCDQAVEAILSGVCTGLLGINTSEYQCGQPSPCAPAAAPGPAVGPGPVCADGPTVPGGPVGSGVSGRSPSGAGPAESVSGPPTTPVAPAFDSCAGAMIAAGSGSAANQFTAPSVAPSGGAELTELTGLLGPLVGVVSQAVAGAVIGIVDAVLSSQAEDHPAQVVNGPPGVPPAAGPPESTTPLDTAIHGADAEKNGSPQGPAEECPDRPEEAEPPVESSPVESAPTEEPSVAQELPPMPEPGTETCPVPPAAPGTAPGGPIPTPRPARLPEPSTQVAPQATDQGPPAPGDEGVLALAGDQ